MTRVFVVLFLSLLGSSLYSQAVRVGEFLHPPFADIDQQTKQAKGAEVEFVKQVFFELGYRPVFVFVPFPRLLEELKRGEVDLAVSLMKTPERAEFLFYSDTSNVLIRPVLVFRKDSPVQTIQSVSDIKGLRIGFVRGQALPLFFDRQELYTLDLYSGPDPGLVNLNKLLVDHLDAALDLNLYNVESNLKKLGIADQVKIVRVPKSEIPCYLVVSKRFPGALALLSKYNSLTKRKKYDLGAFVEAETK